MRQASCVAAMTDENTDISMSITGKLFIHVCFVDPNFNIQSHFSGTFDVWKKDAPSIINCLVAVLNDRGISLV